MTTIKISVKSKRDAILLYKMLQKISFVDKIEKSESLDQKTKGNHFLILRKVLKEKGNSNLFSELYDPVQWQRKLRDEWE
jgi:hypothetical protein